MKLRNVSVDEVRDKTMVVWMRSETRLRLCGEVRDKAMVVWMRLETRGQYSGQDGCTEEASTTAAGWLY